MKLRELHLKGFTSFDGDTGQTIPFGDVTVLAGANGSGKSNLLSFLHLLRAIGRQDLPLFVAKHGADRLLFYGPEKTQAISYTLTFEEDGKQFSFSDRLLYQDPCRLDSKGAMKNRQIGKNLNDENAEEKKYMFLRDFLSHISVYHFNDTSESSRMKDRIYVDDACSLRHDGGNLAAFLKMLRDHAPCKKYYDRIVRHIQRVMPQFGDFVLNPIPGASDYVRLNWKDSSGNDFLFDPHQIPDGALRFMALAAVLLQPPELLPGFIAIDEPELGLPPAAMEELAAMVKTAARNAQILLAVHSADPADFFSADQVLVAERDRTRNCTLLKKA